MRTLTPTDNFWVKRSFIPCPMHTHTMWEIVLFSKGSILHTVNDHVYTSYEGEIFLLGKDHYHSIDLIEDDHEHFDIYCTDTEMKSLCDAFSADLYDTLCNKTVHFSPSVHTFRGLIDSLNSLSVAEFSNTIPQSESKKISLSIISHILGLCHLTHFQEKQNLPAWLTEIIRKLQQPSFFTLSPNEIIQTTHYSVSHFSALFKKYLNTTLSEYVMDKRLTYASVLLKQTNLSMLEIAARAGYDSYSFFQKRFKQKFGRTPKAYRKSSNDSII